jgi:hypothetical protein
MKKVYDPKEIIKAVSGHYGISGEVLCGKRGPWNVNKKFLIYL